MATKLIPLASPLAERMYELMSGKFLRAARLVWSDQDIKDMTDKKFVSMGLQVAGRPDIVLRLHGMPKGRRAFNRVASAGHFSSVFCSEIARVASEVEVFFPGSEFFISQAPARSNELDPKIRYSFEMVLEEWHGFIIYLTISLRTRNLSLDRVQFVVYRTLEQLAFEVTSRVGSLEARTAANIGGVASWLTLYFIDPTRFTTTREFKLDDLTLWLTPMDEGLDIQLHDHHQLLEAPSERISRVFTTWF